AKLNQRTAIVIALAVEETVDADLNPVLERLKDQGRDDDGCDEAVQTACWDKLCGDLAGQPSDDCEIGSDQCRGCQRIGDTPLEDDVHVHQPVTDNGIAPGHRQKDQRQDGNLHPRCG